ITGEKARLQAHFLRALHDVVLIGSGTFTVDQPSLNIRHPQFPDKKNSVAILDAHGRSLGYLSKSDIRKTHDPENIFIFVSDFADISHIHRESFEKEVAQIIVTHAPDSEMIDLSYVLAHLWNKGKKSVLVEGGASVLSSFFRERLVNRVCLFQAPIIMGAGGGLSWTQGLVIPRMSERLELKMLKSEYFDNDLLITGRLK
ncbi:MAG: RibD family protein, partial [Pseudobdellovibrionaceae bacterium]